MKEGGEYGFNEKLKIRIDVNTAKRLPSCAKPLLNQIIS